MRFLFCSIWMLFITDQVFSQAFFRQQVDTTYMWIGDQQYLHQFANTIQLDIDPITSLDSLSWMTILDRGKWTKQNDNTYIRNIKFTVFDSGYFEIPIVAMTIDQIPIRTNPIEIQVNYLPDSSKTLLHQRTPALSQSRVARAAACAATHRPPAARRNRAFAPLAPWRHRIAFLHP